MTVGDCARSTDVIAPLSVSEPLSRISEPLSHVVAVSFQEVDTKGARPASKTRKLQFDILEERRLLSVSYLDNGVIRLGVDLGLGGAITYLTYSSSYHHKPAEPNVVNCADPGREIQQSYYASPDDFDPGDNQNPTWSPWCWNPVQAGDSFGNPSTILAHSDDGTTIYVETQPMQWALDNVPSQATMEEWITLDGPAVQVQCRLTCTRTDNPGFSAPHYQELPAVYTVGTLYQLVSYTGSNPWTNDTLTNLPQANPWASGMPPRTGRPWSTRRVGVWGSMSRVWSSSKADFPAPPAMAEPPITPPATWPRSNSKSSIPRSSTITATDLILGSVSDIRNWVYQHATDPRPNYQFVSDRQHWYAPTGDEPPPSNGYYQVNLPVNDPQIYGPITAFQAVSVPELFISAAYNLSQPDAATDIGRLYWTTDNSAGFNDAQSLSFNIIPDGQYHTYALDLASSPAYNGLITQLLFDPVISGGSGDYVDIASISYQTPGLNQAATVTMLAASANPAVSGQPLTFTATVKPIIPGAGTPTGTVTFEDGGTTLGTGTVNAERHGDLRCDTRCGRPYDYRCLQWRHEFHASSGSMTETLEQIATTTAVTATAKTSVFGQPVTFTATVKAVTPTAGTPKGTVTFSADGTVLGTATLAGGTASFNMSPLGIGSHTITVSYGGNASFKTSSGSLKQTTKPAATIVAITALANPTATGQPVTFTATVTAVAPSDGTPTGTVTFEDGGKILGCGVLSGGTATFTALSLRAGTHKITAIYNAGGSGFGTSISAVFKEIITAVSVK